LEEKVKTWFDGFKSSVSKYWHDTAVYGFTVVCVFLGDYILHRTMPDPGLLPIVAALVVAVIICAVVDLMKGKADTPEKIAGKKRNFTLRIVSSGLAGIGSSALIPVLIKQFLGTMGIAL
jgi:hypothetical protein